MVVARLTDATDRLESLGTSADSVEAGVHRVRRRCKEVRAVVQLLRPTMGHDLDPFDRDVRSAARLLASAREAHATLDTFDRVRADRSVSPETARALDALRSELAARAADATGSHADDGALDEALRLLVGARHQAADWELPDHPSVLVDGLERSYRRARSGLRATRDDHTTDTLHEWRTRTKHLWYQLRLVESASPIVLGTLVASLDDIAEALGDEHDLAVLVERVAADPDAYGGHDVVGALAELTDTRRAELRSGALRVGASVFAERPGPFARRVGGLWSTAVRLGPEGSSGGLAPIAADPPTVDALLPHRSADGDTMTTLRRLLDTLLEVRAAALEREAICQAQIDALPAERRTSGRNLAHYLAVRQFDLRDEQHDLARLGLSSLGRSEGHILATVDAVVERLADDLGERNLPLDLGERGPSPDDGEELLRLAGDRALGPPPSTHQTRLMVTLPTQCAADPALVDALVAAGMTVARINGAHDGPSEWLAMVANVRQAAATHGVDVRVAFDLAGPKLRTGELPAGPEILRVRPRRDERGQVEELAIVRFVAEQSVEQSVEDRPALGASTIAEVPIAAPVIDGATIGDQLRLTDARGRTRRFKVLAVGPGWVEAAIDRTAYLESRLPIRRLRGGVWQVEGRLGRLPAGEPVAVVEAGDPIDLILGDTQRDGATGDRSPESSPLAIPVPVPELFTALRPGHRVLIDDGRIVTTVRAVGPDLVRLEVLQPSRAKVRPEKGINVPDTELALPGLSDDDLAALAVVAPIVDLVSLSYVSRPDDVDSLRAHLDRLGADDVGVVLKIEHRMGFEALPDLLFRALRQPAAAVMVARGDLAVESGFDRLAEVQEQILWLCEAAHVPVIWATQVLESSAKDGIPTRAEITDAARAGRAECVMLNKGPHIIDTIALLDDILTRMHGHQRKRTPMLRRLSVADLPGDGELSARSAASP